MPFLSRSSAAGAVLSVLATLPLAAQSATGAAAIEDSGAVRVQASTSPLAQRGWLSAGLGAGTSWGERSLAGVVAGWYSAGPIAAGVRLGAAAAGPGFSDSPHEGRNDEAFLIGARTPRSRAFILGAVGVARVTSFSDLCVPGPCARFSPFNTTEAAYSIEAHTDFVFAGVGATMFGALGARSVSYNAFALTLDVGWFRR